MLSNWDQAGVVLTPGEVYTITVGAGSQVVCPVTPQSGRYVATSCYRGGKGGDSSFVGAGVNVNAEGGGGGGSYMHSWDDQDNDWYGQTGGWGGSGGGGAIDEDGAQGGQGTSGQGHDGGCCGGNGGGAGGSNGAGRVNSITGPTVTYAAGGNSAMYGGSGFLPAPSGGAGGSGGVVLRFATASYSGACSGCTVSTAGLDTVLTFTSSGSYQA